MGLPFYNEEGGIVMGSPIQTLEVIGLANGQHNNLRNLSMANNNNRQMTRKPGGSSSKDNNIQILKKLGGSPRRYQARRELEQQHIRSVQPCLVPFFSFSFNDSFLYLEHL